MKTHDTVFSSRPVVKASMEFLYGGKDLVFAPYGDHWRQMRKICATNLFNAKRVQIFRDVADEETTIMVNKIKRLSSLREDVNLSEIILGVNNNIISRTTIGKCLEQKEGAKMFSEVANLFGAINFEDLFPSLRWIDLVTGLTRRMRKTSRQAHNLLDEVIEEHLTSKSERKDLVDILLQCENDSTLGTEFTRENMRSVLLDMFVGGTDTSYTTVEWAMAELLTHPSVMKKLQEEVRRVVGLKSKVEKDDINQMCYLTCVIKEALRLHPPLVLSIPRESTASAVVGGYHIPAKTRVLTNLWAISRDPKIWDSPNEFIPERFLNSSVDFRGKDFEFIPFGAGRRGCPGLAFGVISVEYILINLLYWFDWELAGGANNVDIDMTEAFGLSVRLKNALHLVPISHFT